jgi:hypothetical protein
VDFLDDHEELDEIVGDGSLPQIDQEIVHETRAFIQDSETEILSDDLEPVMDTMTVEDGPDVSRRNWLTDDDDDDLEELYPGNCLPTVDTTQLVSNNGSRSFLGDTSADVTDCDPEEQVDPSRRFLDSDDFDISSVPNSHPRKDHFLDSYPDDDLMGAEDQNRADPEFLSDSSETGNERHQPCGTFLSDSDEDEPTVTVQNNLACLSDDFDSCQCDVLS